MLIPDSELILNPDGSIYHLNLKPEELATTVITVGDQDRVGAVSKYFDEIEVKKQKREFVTHTGYLNGQRISVISTGIGTDNIDIVLNELDALVNIDLKTRRVKEEKTSLKIIRIGTSGSMQEDIEVDTFVMSAYGLGMDSLMSFYKFEYEEFERVLLSKFKVHCTKHTNLQFHPYLFAADRTLLSTIGEGHPQGITMTCPGFYAPQGRELRAKSILGQDFIPASSKFSFQNWRLTNFEMETAGIYGLAKVLGHQALSCNAILANRITNEFSEKPYEVVDRLIRMVLERLGE